MPSNDPTQSSAYSYRGLAKSTTGNLDGALVDCTRAIELDPKQATAITVRGVAKSAKGDVDGALADYTRAIELNPEAELESNGP